MSTDMSDTQNAGSQCVGESAGDLLWKLQQNGMAPDVCRRLVLEIEIMSVPVGRRRELADCLHDFVDARRDSQDADDLIAVGSAVRKLVAILPPDELPSVAGLLEAGHRAPVALEVELEIAKAVVRRLSSQPTDVEEEWRPLADRLAEIATAYLNDRLLPRESYAATALNAVLALALMQSDHLPNILERVGRLRLGWFRTLLARRAARIVDNLTGQSHSDNATLVALNDVVTTAKGHLSQHAGVSP